MNINVIIYTATITSDIKTFKIFLEIKNIELSIARNRNSRK